MKYLPAEIIKSNPQLYEGVEKATSWILRERYIYDFFDNFNKNINILDIGCGNGYFLDRLKELGFSKLAGVDISNYLIDKSHRHFVVDINTEKLPLPDKSVDVITAFQVLEHVENYFLILHEAYRVLKNGGHFIFSVPNPFNVFYRFKFLLTGNITGWNTENNHLLFLTKDVFRKTYLRYFILEQAFYNRGPIPLFGRFTKILSMSVSKEQTRILPRHELLSDRVCYFLKKNDENT